MARQTAVQVFGGAAPKKRRPDGPPSDDPLVRAKVRYTTSRVGLRELAKEFKGLVGCSFSNLARVSADEDWPELREQHYDRVVTEAASRLGSDDAERVRRQTISVRNTVTTLDGILTGIHDELLEVLAARKAKAITLTQSVTLLRGLSIAARNVAVGQVGSITLDQQLSASEGSAFQKFAAAAEEQWRRVESKRAELIKRAEDSANKAGRAERKRTA